MSTLKLYLISQTENVNYDTFDSVVVAAYSEDEARNIHPGWGGWAEKDYPSWAATPENVVVKLLGEATDGVVPGVVLASFNAG